MEVVEDADCAAEFEVDAESCAQSDGDGDGDGDGGGDSSTKVSIASHYARCIQLFNQLHLLLESSKCEQVLLQNLLDELGRFRVWASNAGAHRTGRVSLDHRLREASHIHAHVTELLGELNKDLREGKLLELLYPTTSECASSTSTDAVIKLSRFSQMVVSLLAVTNGKYRLGTNLWRN